MIGANDTTYYNFSSLMIYDPSLSYDVVQQQIPTVPFLDYWAPLINLNDSFMEYAHQTANDCGYTAFLEEALTFPPKGPLPTPPNVSNDNDTCDIFDVAQSAMTLANPCYDIYQVATTCPLLWDVLGFPGSFGYVPEGAFVYFNLSDVQRAINAPVQAWDECSTIDVFVNGTDNSPPSALSILPNVIEHADRVIIGHGILDMILMWNGTLIATQNMTWGGQQGFSVHPDKWGDFYVPYHTVDDSALGDATLAAAGNMGRWHTERVCAQRGVPAVGVLAGPHPGSGD